jgi:hypothetical protein
MTAMMQFQSQLEAVERETPRERIGRGKISPMRTHAPMTVSTASKEGDTEKTYPDPRWKRRRRYRYR